MMWHHFEELLKGASARVILPVTGMIPILRLECGKMWEDIVSHALGVDPEYAQWEWDDAFEDLIPRILMGAEVLMYDSGEMPLRYNTPEQVHHLHQRMAEAFNPAFVAASQVVYIAPIVENVSAFYEIADRQGQATVHFWG